MTRSLDLETVQQRVAAALATIHKTANAVAARRDELQAAMDEIAAAGMYDALPSRTAFEARNGGQPVYFYLYWQRLPDGSYEGPGGARKKYIGCDPGAIAEARRMIENRKRWLRLREQVAVLGSVLARYDSDVRRLIAEAEATAGRSWEQGEAVRPADLAELARAAQRDLAVQRGELGG